MSWIHALAQTTSPMTTRRFFDEVAPRVLAARAELARKVGGSYGFRVAGAGEWIVDFDAAVVRAGDADDAALVVAASDDAFARLLAGKLDVLAAHDAGDFDVGGDRSLISRFTAVFRPT
jgi:hypothetical protein